jgi:hypothetical protein
MAYIVCHARKIKTTAGLKAVAKHNCREGLYEFDYEGMGNWHPKKDLPEWITNPQSASLNFGDYENKENQGRTPDATLALRNQEIEKANLKRKPQKNAAAAIEFVFSASPEWFPDVPPAYQKQFLNDCANFIQKKYGHVIQKNAHFDEKTPHIHIVVVPILQTEKGSKYSSSEFLGGRDGLKRLQTEIYKEIGLKYKLERGIEGSTARHDDQVGYLGKKKAEFEAYKKISSNIEIPKPGWRSIVDPDSYVTKITASLVKKHEALLNREKALKERENSVTNRENILNTREISLENQNNELKRSVSALKSQNETLSTQLQTMKLQVGQAASMPVEGKANFKGWQEYAKKHFPDAIQVFEEAKKKHLQEQAEKNRLEAKKQVYTPSQAKTHGRGL